MLNKPSRAEFSLKRKKWWLKRDKNKCQAPFQHDCDIKHPLQIHHILPHGYLHRVAPGVGADYPENAIVLCRTAHEAIHPDVVWARNGYHLNNRIFTRLREHRSSLLDQKKIYWNDTWDRAMTVIALKNTRKYIIKHKFPEYNKRYAKDEVHED